MKRFAGFERGMGIGGWLTNYKRFNVLSQARRLSLTIGDMEHFASYITESDIAYIASLGMDHIRLGFDQVVLEEAPGVYREEIFCHMDHFIGWCKKHGLNVVLNLHKAIGNYCDIKEEVELLDDEGLQARFIALWLAMENRYHEAFGIAQQCDMVIVSGAPQPEPPLEIERKFLIRMPDLQQLTEQASRVIDMEQIYLTGGAPGVSMRIRKSVENGAVTYHRNEKQKLTDMVRIEHEEEIDQTHYNILLGFADPALRVIKKTRYCVPMGELTAEIDIFPFWEDRAFCEVELPHESVDVQLPQWLDVIREVTEDKRYTNLALAREIPMEEI